MILEMRRALEELEKGEHQGYRKLYDATYEEVYCRNLMILQDEKQTADFMETFYAALFENADEAMAIAGAAGDTGSGRNIIREMRKTLSSAARVHR